MADIYNNVNMQPYRQDLSLVYTDLIIMYTEHERDREYVYTKRMTIDWLIG